MPVLSEEWFTVAMFWIPTLLIACSVINDIRND